MTNNPSIYLITGIMASGKSTVAEVLAKRIEKSVHLRGDVFRKMIVSGRVEITENFTEEAFRQLLLRYKITAMAAKEYHEAGFNVIIQDNYYGKMLGKMAELLLPYTPKIIVLNPGVDAVMKREESRNKTGYTGFDIAKLHENFLNETPKLGYWIDTSNLTPEATVQKILEYYG